MRWASSAPTLLEREGDHAMPLDSTDAEPRPIDIALGRIRLAGDQTVPHGAEGIVLFAYGSGSSRAPAPLFR